MKYPFQICVSGAAAGPSVGPSVKLAADVAKEIVARGHIVLTGATRGLPFAAAVAAQRAGGMSIGFSPAASRRAHLKKYKLPIEGFDAILYTGFEYTGRNLILVRSSDAIITIGGRIGTLNEFTIAIEERKPIGVLTGSGGMTAEIEAVLKAARRSRAGIIFDDDPKRLVDRVVGLIGEKQRRLTLDENA